MFITKRKIIIFLYSLFFAIPGLIDAVNPNNQDHTNTMEFQKKQIDDINQLLTSQEESLESTKKWLENYRKKSKEEDKNFAEQNQAINKAIKHSLQEAKEALDSIEAALNAPAFLCQIYSKLSFR